MSPRVIVVIVRNSSFKKFVMELLIDFIEEISVSAIDNDMQLFVGKAVELVDDGVFVPAFGVFIVAAELLFHFPV